MKQTKTNSEEKLDCIWVWKDKEDELQARRLEKRVRDKTLEQVEKMIDEWKKDYVEDNCKTIDRMNVWGFDDNDWELLKNKIGELRK